jgi:hypothetical protein
LKTAFFAFTLSSISISAELAWNPQRGLGWLHELKRPPSTL